jgi:hypothetical protein
MTEREREKLVRESKDSQAIMTDKETEKTTAKVGGTNRGKERRVQMLTDTSVVTTGKETKKATDGKEGTTVQKLIIGRTVTNEN